ncbi:MAG TPA: helix-turn-helix domain-containing protein [Candidatus Omnitrophota bacterium]|nr:helix-turn-helix domain-containing protein [Candidatus Omnitrophota bacterium]
MGVIYKLKPEIINKIIQEKKDNPQLSCRKLIKLIEEKHQVKVSKSSINAIIKKAGLSLPIGRRGERKPALKPVISKLLEQSAIDMHPPEVTVVKEVTEIAPKDIPGFGSIFLKIADSLLGGSFLLTEELAKRLNKLDEKMWLKTEMLIYNSLPSTLWLGSLLKESPSSLEISSYIKELQGVRNVNENLGQALQSIMRSVRSFRFILNDKSVFYLDGQFHTVWSSPNSPHDFSIPYWGAMSYIRSVLQNNEICNILMPPLEGAPSEEFFNFLLGLENSEKQLNSIELLGDRLEIVETLNLSLIKKQKFVFGLWPNQYSQSRIVRNIGEFRAFNFKPLGRMVYLAPAEIVLTQDVVNKSVTLKGIAIKTNLNEKIRLVILTNINDPAFDLERIAKIYLNKWPNLEEGVADFRQKFDYQAYSSDEDSFSGHKVQLSADTNSPAQAFFDDYLKILDLFVRRFFFPLTYQKNDFSSMKEIYNLSGSLEWLDDGLFVRFNCPSGFKYLKDLEYACRRVNERQENVPSNKKIWLSCI